MERTLLETLSLPSQVPAGVASEDGRGGSIQCGENNGSGSGRTYTTIRHSYQLESWDCGVACLVMVRRWLRDGGGDHDDNSDGDGGADRKSLTHPGSGPLSPDEMKERRKILMGMGTTSIWTTDLVWQLHQWQQEGLSTTNTGTLPFCPFRYAFVSRTLAVDGAHRDVGFYRRAFDDDELRVTRTFQRLASVGAPVLSSSPSSLPSTTSSTTSSTPTTPMGDGPNDTVCGLEDDDDVVCNSRGSCINNDNKNDNDGLPLTLVAAILGRHEDCVAIALLDNHLLCNGNVVDDVDVNDDVVDDDDDDDGVGGMAPAHRSHHDETTATQGTSALATTRTTASITDGSSYAGHYVIICGISRDEQHLLEAEAWDRAIRLRSSEHRHHHHKQKQDTGSDNNNDHNNNNTNFNRGGTGTNVATGCPIKENFCFVISNPAPGTPAPVMFVTPRRLEASWRAKGTDEDIIFIRKV